MTLGFDKKEDLRLRMMELEKKLAESEEERCKLEKTCNILMRAFREEEKMRYKALNKKYEKFLEDCNLRRRRNDIILRSLCRIEDRTRALFAKTERLKLLKDRYVSCLKISDVKKDDPGLAPKNFPYSSPLWKVTHDVTPKTVHWKSPNISDVMLGHKAKEFIEPEKISISKYGLTVGSLLRENKEDSFEDVLTPHRTVAYKEQEKDTGKHQNLWRNGFSKDHTNEFDRQENSEGMLESYKPQKDLIHLESTSLSKCSDINYTPIAQSMNLKKDFAYPVIADQEISYSKVLSDEPEEMAAIREKVAVTHQESIEKLKKALSVEDDDDDEIENDKFKNVEEAQKIIEKDEIEMNEKNQFLKNNLKAVNEDLNQLLITKTDVGPFKNDAIDLGADHFGENVEDKAPENPPVGLDGVDYQNETYPESYYEQPVHHSHASIASDVILEEDETEQDADESLSDSEAKNSAVRNAGSGNESFSSKNNNRETGRSSEPHPEKQFINPIDEANNSRDDLQKFGTREERLKVDRTGFDRDDQSRKSDSAHNSEKSNKRGRQSNLMQLLESDSESFQIEHGDFANGNDDSDFDFSFNQN